MAKGEPKDAAAATRILIVEDVPDDAELMKWELRRSLGACTFVRAQCEGDLVRALHLFGPHVVRNAAVENPKTNARTAKRRQGMGTPTTSNAIH